MSAVKGMPEGDAPAERSLLESAPLTPILTIRRAAFDRNVAAMAAYLDGLGVGLAPHVKTHMSPEIWAVQAAAGAERCTVATVSQAIVFIDAGATDVMIASEIIAPGDLSALARRIAADPALDVVVFCDSVAGVTALGAAVRSASARGEVGVLVDVGVGGFRTGVRSGDDALEVATAAARTAGVRMRGLAGYEGVLGALMDDAEARDAALRDYLGLSADVLDRMHAAGLLPADALVTFGGSDLYPAVLERVLPAVRRIGGRLVLRSGCYAFHDHGKYERAQREVPASLGKPSFEPTIGVWGPVVSVPEPGMAVVAVGRRDVGSDAGLPVPLRLLPAGGGEPRRIADAGISGLYDQHTVIRAGSGLVAVGDLMEFGISHPCTTLDRFRAGWFVDDALRPLSRFSLRFP